MNIRDYWGVPMPAAFNLDHGPEGAVEEMLDLRRQDFQGFAEIETQNGFLTPEMNLASSQGQEAVRVLILRGIEEWLEAIHSIEEEHKLEELIDAWNYFLSLAVIDPSSPTFVAGLAWELAGFLEHGPKWGPPPVTVPGLQGRMLQFLVFGAHPVLEKLRNRAWQNSPQSVYFDGWTAVAVFLRSLFTILLSEFGSWELFARYYWTKHLVLQFRLKSRY